MAIQFSDTTNKLGLVQECESGLFGNDYGAISGNTKRLATITRYLNLGLSRMSALIAQADTRWQFHDSNYTTHPIGKTTLVAGQKDYTLAEIHQEVRHVYVKNADGIDVPLKPIDEYDIAKSGVSPASFMSEDGMPAYYDKQGRALMLYPAPKAGEFTASEGLVVTYTSSPSYFVSTDTTKKAGLSPSFQHYPAVYAKRHYALNNQMRKKAQDFSVELAELEEAMVAHFSRRDRDEKPNMSVRKRNYV